MKTILLSIAILILVLMLSVANAVSAQDSPVATPTAVATVEPTVEATPTVVATVEPTVTPVPTPEPPAPPPSVPDLGVAITALLAAFAGLLSSILINLIKQLPFLTEGDKSRLSGAVAEVVSVLVGVITGFVVTQVSAWLGLIEDSSLRALLITVATPVLSELRYRLVRFTEGATLIEMEGTADEVR